MVVAVERVRVCSQCSRKKPIESFNFRNRAKGIRLRYCAECRRGYARDHYKRNKEYYKAKARKNEVKSQRVARALVAEYLLAHPCVDCGETDIIVLQFDHVRDKKRTEISTMVRYGYGKEVLLAEIGKCEIRCANCHLRKTAKERNYHGYMGL